MQVIVWLGSRQFASRLPPFRQTILDQFRCVRGAVASHTLDTRLGACVGAHKQFVSWLRVIYTFYWDVGNPGARCITRRLIDRVGSCPHPNFICIWLSLSALFYPPPAGVLLTHSLLSDLVPSVSSVQILPPQSQPPPAKPALQDAQAPPILNRTDARRGQQGSHEA